MSFVPTNVTNYDISSLTAFCLQWGQFVGGNGNPDGQFFLVNPNTEAEYGFLGWGDASSIASCGGGQTVTGAPGIKVSKIVYGNMFLHLTKADITQDTWYAVNLYATGTTSATFDVTASATIPGFTSKTIRSGITGYVANRFCCAFLFKVIGDTLYLADPGPATLTGTGALASSPAQTYYVNWWTPANLGSTLKLWLDASDVSTFTEVSGKVSQWDDKSGNGKHATQSNASLRPTRTTHIAAGVVDFGAFVGGAGGNIMGLASAALGKTFAALIGSQNGGCFVFGDDSNYNFHRGAPGYGQNASDPIADPSYFILSGSSGTTRKNGTDVNPATTGLSGAYDVLVVRSSGTPTASMNALAQDRTYRSGGQRLSAVIVCDTVLSTDDTDKLEGYLAWTFGQQASLPALHPYKNTAPAASFAYSTGRVTPIRITGNMAAGSAKFGGNLDLTALGDLELWLDADDASTITAPGNVLTEWRDKSGNSRHATTGVSPTVTSELGRGIVDFGLFSTGGGNSRLSFTQITGRHFFIVLGSQNGGGQPFGHSANYDLVRGNQVGDHGQYAGNSWLSTSYASAAAYNANSDFRINGNDRDPTIDGLSGAYDIVAHAFDPAGSTVLNRLFSDRDTYRTGGGKAGEILVYSSVLSSDDRDKVEGYLAWKFGLQANLPPTHPYYSYAPGLAYGTVIPGPRPYQQPASVEGSALPIMEARLPTPGTVDTVALPAGASSTTSAVVEAIVNLNRPLSFADDLLAEIVNFAIRPWVTYDGHPNMGPLPRADDYIGGTDIAQFSTPPRVRRKFRVTITAAQVSAGPHVNFPIVLTEAHFPAEAWTGGRAAKADGSDIRATLDEEGIVVLPRDVVRWDNVNEKAEIWIKIPSLSTTTTLWVWYGNSAEYDPSTESQASRFDVWREFVLVHHLESAGAGESVASGSFDYNELTVVNGTITAETGPWGGRAAGFAAAPYIEATNRAVDGIAPMDPKTELTLSGWINITAGNRYAAIISCLGDEGANESGWGLLLGATAGKFGPQVMTSGATDQTYLDVGSSPVGEWHYVAVTWDTTTGLMKTYVDGVEVSSVSRTGTIRYATAALQRLRIGAYKDANEQYLINAKLDEVRASFKKRSAGWLLTEYNNQWNPAAFATTEAPVNGYLGIRITGDLVSGPAVLEGELGQGGSIGGTGDLTSASAAIAGVGSVGHKGTGWLNSGYATTVGALDRGHDGTSALVSQSATMSGVMTAKSFITGTGALQARESMALSDVLATLDVEAWFDASDASTFSFSSGSNVSQWRDKSPKAHHVTAHSGTAVRGTDGGFDSVYFNGSARLRQPTNTQIGLNKTINLFFVCRQSAQTATWSGLIGTQVAGGGSNGTYGFELWQNPNSYTLLGDYLTTFVNGSGAVGARCLVSGYDPNNTNPNALSIGMWPPESGITQGTPNYTHEAIIIQSNGATGIPDADRQLIEGFLAWKYSLTANLAADHPWKTTDPNSASGLRAFGEVVHTAGAVSLVSGSATMVGPGTIFHSGATASGALAAQATTLAGVGEITHRGTSALVHGAATVVGVGVRTPVRKGPGVLTSAVTHVDGVGLLHKHRYANGALTAAPAVIAGVLRGTKRGTGVLVSDIAVVAGIGNGTIRVSGAIASQSATIDADVELAKQIIANGAIYTPSIQAEVVATLRIFVEGDWKLPPKAAVGIMEVPDDITINASLALPARQIEAVAEIKITAVGIITLPSRQSSGYVERALDIGITGSLVIPGSKAEATLTHGNAVTADGVLVLPARQASGSFFAPPPIDAVGVFILPNRRMVADAFYGMDITADGVLALPASKATGYAPHGTPIAINSIMRMPSTRAVAKITFPPPVVGNITIRLPSTKAEGSATNLGYTGFINITAAVLDTWSDNGSLKLNYKKLLDDPENIVPIGVESSGNLNKIVVLNKVVTGTVSVEWFEAKPNIVKADGIVLGKFRRHYVIRGVSGGTAETAIGSWRRTFNIRGTVTAIGVVTMKRFLNRTKLRGAVIVSGYPDGYLLIKLRERLTREYFNRKEGRRLSLPWLVYGAPRTDPTMYTPNLDGRPASWRVDVDKPFLVDADYTPSPQSYAYENGARPNSIGIRTPTVSGFSVLQFRQPDEGEIIYSVEMKTALRWEGGKWARHITWPQRMFANQGVSRLDPDGVYDYFMLILGLLMSQSKYDTTYVSNFTDATRADEDMLPHLAYTYGTDNADPSRQNSLIEPQRLRERIVRNARITRGKGIEEVLVEILDPLRLSGYFTRLWKHPVTGDIIVRRTPDYSPVDGYAPTSILGLHINNQDGRPLDIITPGVQERLRFFLTEALPVNAKVAYFGTDVATTQPADTVAIADDLTVTSIPV